MSSPQAPVGTSTSPRSIDELRRRREERRRRLRRQRRLSFAAGALAIASALVVAGWSSVRPGSDAPGAGNAAETLERPGSEGAVAADGGVQAAPAPPAGRVTIAAVGDVALGRAPELPADGGASLFAGVDRYLRGDLVLGNLEQALTDRGRSKCRRKDESCFAFRTPAASARHLKRAGFTTLNLANNHTYDFGATGFHDTVAALEQANLGHTGVPGEIEYAQVGKARVAVLGFAPYGTAPDLRDIESARTLIDEAASDAHLVVVTMHAGAEGPSAVHVRPGIERQFDESRGDPVAFAHAAIDAGADLVIGHGPHVLRGIEWYRDRLIAYSLGNFAGHRNFRLGGRMALSGVLRVTLRADGSWVRGKLVPIRLVEPGTPRLDLAEQSHGLVRKLSRQDFGPDAVRMSFEGALVPPGRPMASEKSLPSPGKQGELRVVGGGSAVSGGGPVRRFAVEVEGGLPVEPELFAAHVEQTLFDGRSWAATGGFGLQRVSSGPVDFRVALASPGLTDRLCLPLRTGGTFSCAQGGRAIINLTRWLEGAASYGDRLTAYRRYVVNHEVGHLFGREHTSCSENGVRAPVMVQQTKGVAPCRPNPWPLAGE